MKVKIKNYPGRLTCRFFENYMDKKYGYSWPDTNKFEQVLSNLEDSVQYVYNIINRIYFDRLERKVNVHIDPWDTWNMDNTLALIIVPMLKQLKEDKHGAPNVDNKDVPKELRLTRKEDKLMTYGGDDEEAAKKANEKFFARWDWVMDEMIWAFEQQLTDWHTQYESGEIDIYWKPDPNNPNLSSMEKGPKDTFQVDKEGVAAHNDRMNNGYRLFGKYYQSLWD